MNRVVFDWTSVGVKIAALAEWLPAVSALLSTVWVSLRLYEQIAEMRRGRKRRS